MGACNVKLKQPAKLAAELRVMSGMGKNNRASNDLAAGITPSVAVFCSSGTQLRAGG